jgi:Transposase domain (DUF772)
MLVKQLECNLPFRWFVGLSMDDAIWNATVLCKNQDRLLLPASSWPMSSIAASPQPSVASQDGLQHPASL